MVNLYLVPTYDVDTVDKCKCACKLKSLRGIFLRWKKVYFLTLKHNDVCDMYCNNNRGGKNYFVTFSDYYSLGITLLIS